MIRFGLRDATSHQAAVRLGATLGLAAFVRQSPPTCDWHAALHLSDAQPDALGNDATPDCVEAGYLRQAQMREASAMGSTWKPTGGEAKEMLVMWGDPALGTNLADAQRLAATQGISLGGIDLDVPLPMDVPTTGAVMDAATWAFGSVGLAWALPAYLLQNGVPEVWDVAPPGTSDAATAPGDGHYTPSGAYARGDRRIITWGMDVTVTPAFEARYLTSASAQLSRRWFGAGGMSLIGWDWSQADAIRAALA